MKREIFCFILQTKLNFEFLNEPTLDWFVCLKKSEGHSKMLHSKWPTLQFENITQSIFTANIVGVPSPEKS